jgi:hypothetical protein
MTNNIREAQKVSALRWRRPPSSEDLPDTIRLLTAMPGARPLLRISPHKAFLFAFSPSAPDRIAISDTDSENVSS